MRMLPFSISQCFPDSRAFLTIFFIMKPLQKSPQQYFFGMSQLNVSKGMVIAPIIYIAIFRYTYVHFPERVRIWLDAKTQKTNQKKREAGFSQKCSHFELYHPPLSMKRNESINNLFQYRARVKQDRKVSCLNQQSLKNRRHMNIISIKEFSRNITLKNKSFF